MKNSVVSEFIKKKRMKFVCPQFRKAKAPSTISLAYQQRQVHIAEIH